MQFTGQILDENNYPLVGVNVSFPDIPFVGSATDFNGRFTVNSDKINPLTKVLISYIGYSSIISTVSVIQNSTINLQPKENILNEVVVYGERKSNNNWLLIAFSTYGLFKLKTLMQ